MRRSGARRATDTLSLAWLRGTFGRDAGPSSADFLNHMDWLWHVYHKVGPSGVPPPRARALSRECYAYHIRLFLGRLWDHSKDSCMSLFHPFANCKTHETMIVALVFESHLSRGRPSSSGAGALLGRPPINGVCASAFATDERRM